MSNNKKDSLEDKIKELAKDMGIGFQLSGTTRFGPVAAELVEMGYQRIKKDDIIISREEYEKYQNLKRDVEYSFEYNQGYTDGQIKGSKETAEKCIRLIKETYFTKEALCEFIAKQFGVEIKE